MMEIAMIISISVKARVFRTLEFTPSQGYHNRALWRRGLSGRILLPLRPILLLMLVLVIVIELRKIDYNYEHDYDYEKERDYFLAAPRPNQGISRSLSPARRR